MLMPCTSQIMMTSMKLWRTGIKRRKKSVDPPQAHATEDWGKLLIHRLCPSSAHSCLC